MVGTIPYVTLLSSEWFCIQIDSGASIFYVLLTEERRGQKLQNCPYTANFEEKKATADSNLSPSAYQQVPNYHYTLLSI